MSPSDTASRLASATATWRPMSFGIEEAKRIRDPLCEPLWSGRRALVEVADGEVALRDETGAPLEGFAALRSAIVASTYASEAMLDGYLLPAPMRDTVGAEAPPGMDATPTPRQMGRQLFLGGGGVNRRKEERQIEEDRKVALEPDAPTAFVAVDILWLDGESLLDVPLLERKRLLDGVLVEHAIVRRSVVVRLPVEAWYAQWRALGFHEYAVKGANSRYRPGTASEHWATVFIPKR